MKRGTENLLKFQHLQRDLNLAEYEAVGLLQTLWNKTDINCPRGDIGRFSNEDIACLIGWRGDQDALVAALVRRGWLDEHPEHRLIVHDWPVHCENSTHGKVARALEYFADGTEPKLQKLGTRQNEIVAWYDDHREDRQHTRTCAPTSPKYPDTSSIHDDISTPTVAVTVAYNRSRNRTDGNGVHTHTGTGRNRTTEHISALLPDIGIPASPEPPPRTKLSAARILAATREPPEAERYWAEMATALKTIGRLDVLREGLERLETTSDLDSPAKWLNRQCTRELDKANVKRPKSWKVRT